ncbi:MAG: RlpA-like double-psi beta-barrel domain-containing protein [Candidatus Pacebacteria bacterium]|nr:RlpA-like double-psi beta-barrel domain-containing protein [Candidatus Paceibacterota bacterium]
MYRSAFAAIISLAIIGFAAQFAFAETTAANTTNTASGSDTKACTVGDYKCDYKKNADGSFAKDVQGVQCMRSKPCDYTCPTDQGGGTIKGACAAQNNCQAETTCNGKTPQKPTMQQIQDALGGSQSPNATVSQDFKDLTTGQAQPSSATQTGTPSTAASGSNLPTVTPPPSWLQTVGVSGSSQSASLPYMNQSVLTQALNSLSGNQPDSSGATDQTAVPTTQEQYLQSTFGTTQTGDFQSSGVASDPSNYKQTLASGDTAYIIPPNDPLNQEVTQNAALANGIVGSNFSVVAKLPDGSVAILPGTQYGISDKGYVGVAGMGLTDSRLQGTGLEGVMTSLGLSQAPQPVDQKLSYMLEGQAYGATASDILGSQNNTTGATPAQDLGQLMNSSAKNAGWGTYLSDNLGLGGPVLAVTGNVTTPSGESNSFSSAQPVPFDSVSPPTKTIEIELPPPTSAPETASVANPPVDQAVVPPLPDPIIVQSLPEPKTIDQAVASDQSQGSAGSSGSQSAGQQASGQGEQSIGTSGQSGSGAGSSNGTGANAGGTTPPASNGNTTAPASGGGQVLGGLGGQSGAANGGATGGSSNATGGSSAAQILGSLLGGFLGGSQAQSGSPSQSVQTNVYSSNLPIVSIPASSDGLLGPCPTQTNQTNSVQQQPCGATSNVPVPQLTASLPLTRIALASTGSGSAQSDTGSGLQTIIPANTNSQVLSTGGQTNMSGQSTGSQQTNTQTIPTGIPSQSQPVTQKRNNTPSNPVGTTQGPTGTANPSGSQQGGTGAPSTNPGSGSAQQSTQVQTTPSQQTQVAPTQTQVAQTEATGAGTNGIGAGSNNTNAGAQSETQNASNCLTLACWARQQLNTLAGALQGPGQALADLFSVGAAQAGELSLRDQALRDTRIAQNGLNVMKSLSWWPSKSQEDAMAQGTRAAERLSNSVKQLGNPTLGNEIGQYVNFLHSMSLPQNQSLANQSKASAMGDSLLSQTQAYITALPVASSPASNSGASIGPIGTVAPPAASTGGQSTGTGTSEPSVATTPVSQTAQQQAQTQAQAQTPPHATYKAQSPTLVGAASTYNPFKPGWKSGGAQTATGNFYNPNAYDAALQLDLAKQYNCGIGNGNNCYALVEHDGKQLVVNVNDNGPLVPGRIIDLNEASMNYFGGMQAGVLDGVKVTLLQGNYQPGPVNGGTPSVASCNYRGCATPTPTTQVAQARVSGLTSTQSCSNQSSLCAIDPTTGAAFTCEGDQTQCLQSFQQQLALSRLCASNPATCAASTATYSLKQVGQAQPAPEPRRVISVQSNYGTTGKLARNPNVPTISGISSQDFISRLRASGVSVQDQSSASLSSYPHGKNEMAALTWHGSGTGGADSGLVQTEISQNNNGSPAAQMVLQRDGTLVVVAPVDALSFHAATTNKMGPGIEIQGLTNQGDNPTPAQIVAMEKITNVAMDQLGWEVGTHGQIEPGHRDSLEAGPVTMAYVYQGVVPAPVPTYQFVDQNGQPILDGNGKPITTTQSPNTDGTGQFLTNPDGTLQLDQNGQPIPVTPVPVAQDPSNPNQYTAPDDRPAQPKPANPWPTTAGYPYTNNPTYTTTPVGAPSQFAQTSQPAYSSQPQQQTSGYPLVQQPVVSALQATTTATSTPPAAVVSIVTTPTSVKSGGSARISWSSVGTKACQVVTSSGFTIGTTTAGSVFSPKLTATTLFTIQCQTLSNSIIATSTSVGVQ